MTYSADWQIEALKAQVADLKERIAAADRNAAKTWKETVSLFAGLRQNATVIIATDDGPS